MRVLAHFKDFNLTSLQFDVTDSHLLFRHNLYSNTFTGLFVDGGLNETKLALAQCVFDVVEVEQIAVTDNLLYRSHPLLFIFLCQQVVAASLVPWEDEFERVQDCSAV
jgi:hypothetical protein